jgi:hypothetical protein
MALSVRLYGNVIRARELVKTGLKKLEKVKESMSFQDLQQLMPVAERLEDGSLIRVKSFFGIDIVEIIGATGGVVLPEKEDQVTYFVFLVYRDGEVNNYSVWRISDNSITASPIDLEDRLNYFVPSTYRNPSEVKSDTKYKNHTYAIENNGLDPECYATSNIQYGKLLGPGFGCPAETVLLGMPNSYIDGVFDEGLEYQGYGTLCESRNSSYINSERFIIKDLAVWPIDATSADIRYRKRIGSGWPPVIGPVITFGSSSDVFAAISEDKVILKDASSAGSYDNGHSPVYAASTHCCNLEEWPWNTGDTYMTTDSLVDTGIFSGHLYFGSVDIGMLLDSHVYWHIWSVQSTVVSGPGPGTVPCYNYQYVHNYSFNGTYRILDYDNLNADETFIIFINRHSSSSAKTSGSVFAKVSKSGTFDDYYFVYRVNGVVSTVEIAETVDGSYGSCSGGSACSPCSESFTHGIIYGQRPVNISCKVCDRYIAYSYVLEDYIDSSWVYNSRIVGIIDVNTGTINVYEVDDSNLGQYADTFDEEEISAIGIHKITREVTAV